MDILSAEFLSALAAIVVIDLVLAGDNAIVIALAARSLPRHLQKRAIAWGTVRGNPSNTNPRARSWAASRSATIASTISSGTSSPRSMYSCASIPCGVPSRTA